MYILTIFDPLFFDFVFFFSFSSRLHLIGQKLHVEALLISFYFLGEEGGRQGGVDIKIKVQIEGGGKILLSLEGGGGEGFEGSEVLEIS